MPKAVLDGVIQGKLDVLPGFQHRKERDRRDRRCNKGEAKAHMKGQQGGRQKKSGGRGWDRQDGKGVGINYRSGR